MAAHTSSKLEDVLAAVVTRLIAQIADLSVANCYLSINPDATPEPNPGKFVVVVAPTSGVFNEGYYDGGGDAQATVESGIVVKIHSPVRLDQKNRETEFLTNSSLGLLSIWRAVVKALVWPWQLQIGGNDGTRDPLIPADYTFTRKNRRLGAVEQSFKCSFDLDLS